MYLYKIYPHYYKEKKALYRRKENLIVFMETGDYWAGFIYYFLIWRTKGNTEELKTKKRKDSLNFFKSF